MIITRRSMRGASPPGAGGVWAEAVVTPASVIAPASRAMREKLVVIGGLPDPVFF
jgi:hypothetical protein